MKSAAKAGAGAAVQPMADPGMFDQLTDGDFQREVPFGKVAQSGADENQTLSRFTYEEAEKKKKEAGSAKGFIIFTAVLNILSAFGMLGFVILFAMQAEQLGDIGENYPLARVGTGIGVALTAVLMLMYVAGAVGLFLKTSWGWIITGALCDFFIIERLGALGVLIKDGFDQAKFFGVLIGLLAGLFYTMGFFRSAVQEACGIKNKVPAIIATVVGFAIGIGAVLAIFQTYQSS